MAKIFNSYFMQSEFTNLYRKLIPNLNKCNACRIEKCKFCFKFFNSILFYYYNATKEPWDYICNFLHDFLRLHWVTKQTFKDVSKIITFLVNTVFL